MFLGQIIFQLLAHLPKIFIRLESIGLEMTWDSSVNEDFDEGAIVISVFHLRKIKHFSDNRIIDHRHIIRHRLRRLKMPRPQRFTNRFTKRSI